MKIMPDRFNVLLSKSVHLKWVLQISKPPLFARAHDAAEHVLYQKLPGPAGASKACLNFSLLRFCDSLLLVISQQWWQNTYSFQTCLSLSKILVKMCLTVDFSVTQFYSTKTTFWWFILGLLFFFFLEP